MNISRQLLYTLTLSFVFLILVIIFSVNFLIPEGKQYRIKRVEAKKHDIKQSSYQLSYDKVYEEYKNLKSNNKNIITAYDTKFNKDRFIRLYGDYFKSLTLNRKRKVFCQVSL